MLSRFSCVQLLATIWTVACQFPLSMGFSRQAYWSGLPRPPPGDLPDSGIEPTSLVSSVLAGGFFTTGATWEALFPNSITNCSCEYSSGYSWGIYPQMMHCLSSDFHQCRSCPPGGIWQCLTAFWLPQLGDIWHCWHLEGRSRGCTGRSLLTKACLV